MVALLWTQQRGRKMIRLATKMPRELLNIAVSGGPDSMATLDFFRRTRSVRVVHVNHGTEQATRFESCVLDYCAAQDIPVDVHRLPEQPVSNRENYWSIQRSQIYDSYQGGVVTGHTLDDAFEWWLMTSMTGNGRIMLPRSSMRMRPMLLTTKEDLVAWCARHDVPYVVDQTNIGNDNTRAALRHGVLPALTTIYPGWRTMMRKRVANQAGLLV